MADKLVIDIFRMKNAEQFSKALSEKDGKPEIGSAAAYTGANACALAHRAALLAIEENGAGERLDYIERNLETVRGYMVFLIDEDVKCRGPLKKALKEGGEREIEAARQPAVCICAEIINMMDQCLALMKELTELCPPAALHYVAEAAELAMAAAKSARHFILSTVRPCSDEIYIYVTKKENDTAVAECAEHYRQIMEKAEEADV